ncbi:hypothetical protein DFH29DRAFT_213867 [Suillus ampliporus]|nr:hypothetical protein DFH29DRAFT_213867 [Suillus ampliporus]
MTLLFGSPVARVHSVGYLQLCCSTNATLYATDTLLDHALHVDATHEVIGPDESRTLPSNHFLFVPHRRACTLHDEYAVPVPVLHIFSDPHIRIIINHDVVPLRGIRTCPYDAEHRMCPPPAFIEVQQETIRKTNQAWGCHGNLEFGDGRTAAGVEQRQLDWRTLR